MGLLDFFTEAPENTQVNTAQAFQKADFYQDKSEDFFDPNNSFYTKAMARYNTQNLDAALALARQSARSRTAQGINSLAINEVVRKDLTAKAAESTQAFGQGLYRQGLGTGTQLAGISQGFFGQGMQGDLQNAQANAQWQNSFLDIGSTLAGGFLGGGVKSLFGGDNQAKLQQPNFGTSNVPTKQPANLNQPFYK